MMPIRLKIVTISWEMSTLEPSLMDEFTVRVLTVVN